MSCVGDQIKEAVCKYCGGRMEEATEELSQLFGGSAEIAQRALRFLHIFLEKDGTSLVPVDESGLFLRFDGHEISVRINSPSGNQLTVTFSSGEWR